MGSGMPDSVHLGFLTKEKSTYQALETKEASIANITKAHFFVD
jgi:hypothetical protein